MITTKEAMDHIRTAMRDDPEYARGWHDNMACAAVDEGVDHAAANRIATRFMYNAFGVKTGDHVGIKPEDWFDIIGG